LTDGDATAVGALAIGDWTAALTDCVFEIENEQTLNPWSAFEGGGKCVIRVPAVSSDQFGIDTHRSNAGAETTLRSTLDRNDTSIDVVRTAGLTSGVVSIGTETIAWSAKPDDHTLTSSTSSRGRYSHVYGSTRFADHHRCVTSSNGVRLEPVVSEQPRIWIGRRVGVWMHRVSGGTIDSATEAQLVFAGQIAEIRDDPNTFHTCVMVEHVIGTVGDHVLGGEIFEGECVNGFHLAAGRKLAFQDWDGTTLHVANPLEVVASGATGSGQVNDGYYTIEELLSIINAWLAGEGVASRVRGTYTFNLEETANGRRVSAHWLISAGGTVGVYWRNV
jgi:hypothetical protein